MVLEVLIIADDALDVTGRREHYRPGGWSQSCEKITQYDSRQGSDSRGITVYTGFRGCIDRGADGILSATRRISAGEDSRREALTMLVLRRSNGQYIEIRHRSGDMLRVTIYDIHAEGGPPSCRMAFDGPREEFDIQRPERAKRRKAAAAIAGNP